MNPELEQQPKESIFDQTTILYEEGRFINALVPIDLIDRSDVPVDEDHAQELADSMKKRVEPDNPTGQDTPVGLAHIPGEDKFRITDGFHRTRGKKDAGEKYVLCRIRTNSTMEEVIDSRIVSATSHEPTKIPRLVEWINDSWKLTPWGDEDGVSVKSAFALAQRNSSGVKLGLNQEEATKIKELVRSKAKKWNLEVATVLSHLDTAEKVDPELLKSSRKREGSKDIQSIPPKHLEVLRNELPGSDNFPLQRLVVDFSIENNLNMGQTKIVAKEVAKCKNPEEAIEKIDDPEWKKTLLENPAKPTKRPKKVGTETTTNVAAKSVSSEKIENRYVKSEIELCRLAIENTVLSNRYIALPLIRKKKPMPIVYAPHYVPEHAKPFPWTGKNHKDVNDWLASVQHQGLQIAESQAGSLNQQTTKDIVEATNDRIREDMRDGALLYTGIDSKQLLTRLYVACLNEQIQHRIKKSSSKFVPSAEAGETEVAEQVKLNRSSFRNAVVNIEETSQRRVLELTAMFKLPAFAIAQILDIPKPDVKALQTKSVTDLGLLKPSGSK